MANSNELISIHFGQAGVQMGNAFWELMCLEHGLKTDGFLRYNETPTSEEGFIRCMFEELNAGNFTPRTLVIDSEPSVIDEMRVGVYRHLFKPDCVSNGLEDAAGNYARGHNSLGQRMMPIVVNMLRKQVELCDRCQGYVLFSSLGGGTGSGLMSLFANTVSNEIGDNTIEMQFALVPSNEITSSPTEPYNAVLSLAKSAEIATNNEFVAGITTLMDNQALYKICENQLAILRPTFTSVNRIIAPMVTGLTATMRFPGALTGGLNGYLTNLVPFPELRYPVIRFAPFTTQARGLTTTFSTKELTHDLFKDGRNSLTYNESQHHCNIATCIVYRGEHNTMETVDSLNQLKMSGVIKTVNWCPTGFKLAHTSQPPISLPGMGPEQLRRSVVMLANSTAVKHTFTHLHKRFNTLFQKRSFLHWYVGEGMEPAEFSQAESVMQNIKASLTEIEQLNKYD